MRKVRGIPQRRPIKEAFLALLLVLGLTGQVTAGSCSPDCEMHEESPQGDCHGSDTSSDQSEDSSSCEEICAFAAKLQVTEPALAAPATAAGFFFEKNEPLAFSILPVLLVSSVSEGHSPFSGNLPRYLQLRRILI